jgi:hypothetical protein
VDVSGVLNDAWGLYRRFFVRFVLTAAVVYVALGLLSSIATEAAEEGGIGVAFWGLLSLVFTVVGLFWLQGALVEAVRDVRDGRADVPISELYGRTRPRLPALISAGVLAAIGIGIGLLLLIVPGLYLLVRWALVVPVIVLEGRSAGESFTRSWELVRGHGWSVLGVILLTLVGAAIANILLAGLFSWLPDFLARWIGGTVANSIVIPFVALAWTLMYYRLAEPAPAPVAAEAA